MDRNPLLDDFESACPECGEDSMNGRLCFGCSRQKAIDNYEFDGWEFCPECGTMLIMQHDWRVALFKCQLCGAEFGSGEILFSGDE